MIIVILFTRGLPYVQRTKNRLTCENHTANYKNFSRSINEMPAEFQYFQEQFQIPREFQEL